MCAERSPDWNYLVVSDLHIGELGSHGLEGIRAVDRALVRFVDWYRAHREEGRPWRLIIAGDGIDFLHFSLKSLSASQDEANAVRALEQIVAENRAVFAALARFVGAGHELLVLKGNHDAELHWDRVQERLRALLLELWIDQLEGRSATVQAVEAYRARVTVHRWFYHHHGVLYVEHGNQYDELCSFEHVLCPVGEDHEIESPLSHVTLRAFADVVRHLDPHAVDRWALGQFLRWVSSLGPALVLRAAGAYLGCAAWLTQLARRVSKISDDARAHHERRMRDLVEHFDLEHEALELLDRLKRRPAGHDIRDGFRMLFFDQLLLVLATASIALGLALGPGSALVRAAAGVTALAAAWAVSRRWLRGRRVEAHPKLAESAVHVAAIFEVPLIVFGHSHVPEVQRLEGATYVNTGSWTHDGESGLTHLCVALGEGITRAELRRWNPVTSSPDAVATCPV
ncbi:metallophosphoesterase [Myxococcota bacterium]|nr:metallophosphoesterase [Myxococcota bacterium]